MLITLAFLAASALASCGAEPLLRDAVDLSYSTSEAVEVSLSMKDVNPAFSFEVVHRGTGFMKSSKSGDGPIYSEINKFSQVKKNHFELEAERKSFSEHF